MKAGRLIVFPKLDVAIYGWPETVSLSPAEARAMEQIHLGGIEALRTETYRCACATVTKLVAKGLLDKFGVTPLGKAVAATFAPEYAA